jgi:deazaflavin-dependent oxidoreductase (nitroreductase family)
MTTQAQQPDQSPRPDPPSAQESSRSGRARPPLGRRLQTRVFRVVNVPMRAILGLPFGTPLGRNLMLAYIVGRKSGKTYRQPVSYVRDGETLLTPGGGRWKLNLSAGLPVRLRVRGRDLTATADLVSDVDEVDRLLTIMIAGNPRARAFIGIARDADGRFDRAQLANAVNHGFRIVRWHPANGG